MIQLDVPHVHEVVVDDFCHNAQHSVAHNQRDPPVRRETKGGSGQDVQRGRDYLSRPLASLLRTYPGMPRTLTKSSSLGTPDSLRGATHKMITSKIVPRGLSQVLAYTA